MRTDPRLEVVNRRKLSWSSQSAGIARKWHHSDIYQKLMANDTQPLPKRGTAQASQLKLLKLTVFVLRPALAPFVTSHATLQIRIGLLWPGIKHKPGARASAICTLDSPGTVRSR